MVEQKYCEFCHAGKRLQGLKICSFCLQSELAAARKKVYLDTTDPEAGLPYCFVCEMTADITSTEEYTPAKDLFFIPGEDKWMCLECQYADMGMDYECPYEEESDEESV